MFKFKMFEFLLVVTCILNVACADVKRPNIVMFLTDDQDLVLNGMEPMENVRNLIANEGAVFTNAFVASPICCPSRATILTGMYPHNHGTVNNSVAGGCYGDHFKRLQNYAFPAILQQNGYTTFYAGKYLNQYGKNETGGGDVPPGWDEWHGLVGNSVYYNYSMSDNGNISHVKDEYLTDLIRKQATEFLSSKHRKDPFLIVLAPPAPHQPFTPAPRHQRSYLNVTAIRTPNFNISAQDKHWLMRMSPSPLPPAVTQLMDSAQRLRWASLRAVDEMVADVISRIDDINNTYVIYTSDNGYHIGQFSQVLDKRQPYETDIRVPLTIRGPGIDKKILLDNPTINVDLAPTILSMAGITPPPSMDGTPIKFNKNEGIEERNMLIEYHGEGSTHTVDSQCVGKSDGMFSECSPTYACKCQDVRNNTYSCVRHLYTNINFKYCLFDDNEKFEEMYDLTSDPYELTNIVHDVMPAVHFWYKFILEKLKTCSGATCQAGPVF